MKTKSMLKTTSLHGCSSLLVTYEKDFPVPGMQVGFSTSHGLGLLNGLSALSGLKRMVGKERFLKRRRGLSVCSGMSEQDIDNFQNLGPIKIHTLYSGIVNIPFYNSSESRTAKVMLPDGNRKVEMLKTCTKEMLGHQKSVNLFTVKFHMIDHVAVDVSTF